MLKKWFLVATVFVALGLGAYVVAVYCGESPGQKISRAVLSYLAQPAFADDDLLEQVTGVHGALELYDLDKGLVYFSLASTEEPRAALAKLTNKPEEVMWGKLEGNRLLLDSYVLRKPGFRFCRFAAADFQVNPAAVVAISFPSLTYTVSVAELACWADDEVLAGGPETFVAYTAPGGRPVSVVNFGGRVATAGEPSLGRLVNDLIRAETEPTRQAQRLLSFVTDEIVYDHEEADWRSGAQVIRRPVETLLTRRATCASKAVLYASLLTQVGIDYRLGYYPTKQHLTMYVAGQYPNHNGGQLLIGGQPYSLAETTCRGFVIGETDVGKLEFADLLWLSEPVTGEIVNPHTNERRVLK